MPSVIGIELLVLISQTNFVAVLYHVFAVEATNLLNIMDANI